jgi:hypothetical protein
MGDANQSQTRVRQACDPCRRKKVKCPGEKPSCSFCTRLNQQCSYARNSEIIGYRVEKSDDSRYHDGQRVQRLEARVEQIMDAVTTLVDLQAGRATAPVASGVPRTLSPPEQLSDDATDRNSQHMGVQIHGADDNIPSPGMLRALAKVYLSKVADQPLVLFDAQSLADQIARSSKALLYSFLALTARYSAESFFSGSKSEAAQGYTTSASKLLFAQACDPTGDVQVLQAFCLLTLCHITDGRPRKAWMTLGVGVRFAICAGWISDSAKRPACTAEILRACWTLFVLDRMYGSSFRTLPAIMSSEDLPEMPVSPKRPETSQSSLSGELGDNTIIDERDVGITACVLRLLSIWGRLMEYLRSIKNGLHEDAWSAGSKYQQIKSEMSKFETTMPEVHRAKHARFHDLSSEDLQRDRSYWRIWIFEQCLYHAIHTALNHPFLHIAKVPGRRGLRSPSFLQHTTDQAVLHCQWVVLIFRLCGEKAFEAHDPFLGHLAAVTATALFFLQFSKDDALAKKAYRDFHILRVVVGEMTVTQPHLQHTVGVIPSSHAHG